MQDKIIEYYNNYDEDGRLKKDNLHKVEFLTTTAYFDKYFSSSQKILDACAGTGVYAFYFAEKGHEVTACDLVSHNVEIMKKSHKADMLKQISVCDVLNISEQFEPESFDCVLCMGALYHLRSKEDRLKAIKECFDATKKGGYVVLAYVNMFPVVMLETNDDLSNMDEMNRILNKQDDYIFTFSTPDEIESLAEQVGLKKVCHFGADGMFYSIIDKVNNASDEDFKKLMEYHLATCEEPSILGASMHGLYIGQKL